MKLRVMQGAKMNRITGIHTYNGWTNYATWRVNRDFFDGFDLEEYFQLNIGACDLSTIPADLKNYVETFLQNQSIGENSTVLAYAIAFLSDVNWHEIAKHMIEDHISENLIEE